MKQTDWIRLLYGQFITRNDDELTSPIQLNFQDLHALNSTFRRIKPPNILLVSTVFQKKMSYFVIGVSGVTCGGKTTMSKLLQKSFPRSRVIHQDKYFLPDSYDGHIRLPEIDNHVNYDVISALDMKKMHRDVLAIIKGDQEQINGYARNGDSTPNFEEGQEFMNTIVDNIGIDTSEYAHIPILIIEGFTMFASDILYEKSDVRFFLTLDEETCRKRRSLRNFDPPDGEGYFDHCIWPEYQQHYKECILNRPNITVYSGKSSVYSIWKESVELILKKIDQKSLLQKNR